MKVLIVDDSEVVSNRLKDMLDNLDGLEILGSAKSVIEGIDMIDLLNPDIIISDLRMPGGSGFDIITNVKKNNSSKIVIVLTNYPEPHYEKKCMELGADYFLDKSNDFEKIIDICSVKIKELNA